ncbi:hypothetical protein B566_EDAN005330 [Ephemera danica]|nr:hypothetical protein B566_EDAN005330 [Ephemera danica]
MLVEFTSDYCQLEPVDPSIPAAIFNSGCNLQGNSMPKIKHEILSLDDDDDRLRSFFDPSLPTAVYVHGFFEGAKASSMRAVRSAYLLRKDHNFMAVNWQMLASAPWYPKAVVHFPMVARNLAQILDRLVKVGAIKLETLHLIGFSLGSHVCGATARLMTVGRVPRITALDPAYPLITSLPREQRLDNTTADFIDVIHTCGGLYGLFLPVGHADFYPNGGTYVQPGCWTTFAPFTCSHWRSWRFFVESLMGGEFVATSCDSWKNFQQGKCNNNHKAIMGQEVDQTYV